MLGWLKKGTHPGNSTGVETKERCKVIVAIDFGTNGTSIGYAIINDDDQKQQVYIEQDWCSNMYGKSKTDILLTHDGKFITFGDDALTKLSDNSTTYHE